MLLKSDLARQLPIRADFTIENCEREVYGVFVSKVRFWLKIAGRTVGAAIILGAGWIGYNVWDTERPPVSEQKLAQLTTTMDTNAVRRLLGNPSRCETFTNELGDGSFDWEYSRPSGWKFVNIEFGPDGHFRKHGED